MSELEAGASALLDGYRSGLYVPDPDPVLFVLGAVVANLLPGDPFWAMLVGPPSSCKTELLNSVSGLPNVHAASVLTEQALLSGTSYRDRSARASGGLLRRIGEFGIVVLKDFTSILAMHRERRGPLLAAVREIYDGSWVRHVGVDGGRELRWTGKLGLLAACTEAVDTHHAVMAALGERFLLFRMPANDEGAEARFILEGAGSQHTMRRQLADWVGGFFEVCLDLPEALPSRTEAEEARLVALASLAVRCRSAVERDPYRRDIVAVPQPERPGRMLRSLAQMLAALTVLDVRSEVAWRVLGRIALDCMPSTRRKAFDVLRNASSPLETAGVATAAASPPTVVRRGLEELEAHRIVERASGGSGRTDSWQLSDWARQQLGAANVPFPNCRGTQ